jgi:transketolase C-terminal domain/subunit
VIGGLGSAVSEIVSSLEIMEGKGKAIVKRLGIEDEYCSVVGDQKFLRHRYGIGAEDIVNSVLEYEV